MFVEDRGLIFDAAQQPISQRIAYFTSLCPTSSGTILCGFQLGSSKHGPDSSLGLCHSHDGGATWERVPCRFETVICGIPGSLAGAELVEVEPGRLLLFATWFDRSDPQRPLFDPVTQGILHEKQLYAFSNDKGRSWSQWQELGTPGLTGRATTGPIVKWPDGTIAYAFESFKDFDDPGPGHHGAWTVVSRDRGRSFSPPLLVAQHPAHQVFYWDQRLCPGRARGDWIALFWTHDLQLKKDLRVHLRKGSITSNNRIESSSIVETTIPGQIAAPLLLDDGRLLAFVVHRGRPGTMTLWTSFDQGVTWPEKDRLIVYTHDEKALLSQSSENIDFNQYWEDMGKWTFGHPAIRALGGDRVFLAWYAGSPSCLSIYWARINTGGASREPSL